MESADKFDRQRKRREKVKRRLEKELKLNSDNEKKELGIKDAKNIMFNGQAQQDRFVLTMLNYKKNGFFLELGSQHPKKNNNTFILEHKYDWNGIMVEYINSWLDEYKIYRPNSIHIIDDAQNIDYN